MDDWDKSWLVDECLLCDICGHEVENAKQEVRNVNSLMECTDMLEKLIQKSLNKCLNVWKSKKIITKLESYEEVEIVSQSWLQEQTQHLKFHESIRDGLTYMTSQLIEERLELTQEIDQFGSDIHDLKTHLNKRLRRLMPNYKLSWKEYKSENIVNNVALELRQFESLSKHFSIKSKLMDEYIDEEQDPYILKVFSPRRQNDIPHLRAKKCKMRHILLGSFVFIPPPLERSRKIDVKLGVLEKSEYPKFGAKEHV
ncbi:hypothetical protein H5410_022819 [Solanum commersonii]|uniref:Uncharacterized protein n=1 Tax=Solanum commersonii TaxID=4109 RepID=A0A9J5ZFT9_SOLCO|nr:hypothetical protein H5410_022819 [Solanum commersonii]